MTGNSDKSMRTEGDKPEIKPVTTNVVVSDKSPAKSGVGDYILNRVFIPFLKDTVFEGVTGALKMIMFGEDYEPRKTKKGKRRSGSGQVSYASMFDDYSYGSDRDYRDDIHYSRRETGSFKDIYFEYHDDAREVLQMMKDFIQDYGAVTVNDYYEMVGKGKESPYTATEYGWRDLRRAYISEERKGYVINLPKARHLG